MKLRAYCPDIECDSCVKVLDKAFSKLQGIERFDVKKTYIDVEYQEAMIKPETILQTIKDKGYRAYTSPYNRKPIKERAKEFMKNKKKYEIERVMLKNILITTLVVLAISTAFLFYMNTIQENFFREESAARIAVGQRGCGRDPVAPLGTIQFVTQDGWSSDT